MDITYVSTSQWNVKTFVTRKLKVGGIDKNAFKKLKFDVHNHSMQF